MRKPLAGKRAFFAQGQRAAHAGKLFSPWYYAYAGWLPDWAVEARRAGHESVDKKRRICGNEPSLMIIDEWDFMKGAK